MRWDAVAAVPPSSANSSNNNAGYCVLTFGDSASAAVALTHVNSPMGAQMTMPNSARPFVFNWAPPASANGGISPAPISPGYSRHYPKEYSIFVGDLAPETSNSDLVAVFRNPVLGLRNDRPFASCKSAKIMLDPVTGVSRGYGFVRFTDEADQQRALIEMHGLYCLSRPMRVSLATAKFKPQPPSELPVSVSAPGGYPGVWLPTSLTSTDPYNTTVFVGGLSLLVGEDTLRTFFAPFGEIHYVKVPVGKHCGFVQFVRKADAERAIGKMQGFPVGGSRIRLSWGRSQLASSAAGANGVANGITPAMPDGMTHEQAVALLQKFQMQGFAAFSGPPAGVVNGNGYNGGYRKVSNEGCTSSRTDIF
ncbi:hypothetical protein R3P38DRAFT_3394418 [Favolaschia claudopus]|uniref:RRM domain-containing protein n=1 Tax=Favolaschia claudopus TaxID=2862362 RepID=A0AAW0BQP5_9AGAR